MSHAYRIVVLVVAVATLGCALWLKTLPLEGRVARPGAAPVHVDFKSPAGPTGWKPQIVASFNKPIVPLGDSTYKSPIHPFQFSPPASGTYRWIGSHTVTFTPDSLAPSTLYTVTLPAGLTAQDGTVLPAPFTWTFETPRPAVRYSYTNCTSESRITADAIILVEFNQAVQPDALRQYIHLVGPTLSTDVPFELRRATSKDVSHETATDDKLAVVPTHPLPMASQFRLTVDKGYAGTAGQLVATTDHVFNFSTHGPLTVVDVHPNRDISPDGETTLRFSNPVRVGDVLAHVKVQPPIQLTTDVEDREETEVTLSGPWKAATSYVLRVDGDLTDVFDEKLGAAIQVPLTVGHYSEALDIKTGLWSLESQQPHEIPIRLVNLPSVELGEKLLNADTVVPWLREDSSKLAHLPRHAEPGVQHDDVVTWKTLSLQRTLGTRSHGLVWVQVAEKDYLGRDDPSVWDTLVQVTDLAINLKQSSERSVVWVTSLTGGRPVRGAQVQFRDYGNEVRWRGTTDQNGMVVGPGRNKLGLDENGPLWAIATLGDDTVAVREGTSDGALDIGGFSDGSTLHQGYMFTERGLYRAGETVHIKGLWRELHNGQWQVPPRRLLHLTVSNGRNETVQQVDVHTDDYGSFNDDLDLDALASSGLWSIDATLANHPHVGIWQSFQVQAYHPVTFEVKVDSQHPAYVQGETLHATVSSQYLFGAPVQDGAVTWTANLSNWSASFADFGDFEFGGADWLSRGEERWYWRRDEEWESLTQGQSKLSADGLLPVSFLASCGKYRGSNRQLTIEANVEAAGHRQVSGRTVVPVWAADVTLGLRLGTDFLEVAKPEIVSVVAVGPDGKAQAGRSVHVRLVRRQWDSVRHEPRARWDSVPHDTEIQSLHVTSGLTRVLARVKPTQPGFYYIDATARDAQGRIARTVATFWVWGDGYAAWSRAEGDRLTLVADKLHYAPGDTAHVMIQNPYESAYALVTEERETIMQRRVVQIHGSAPVIDIPLDARDIPNVYVSVVLIQGRHGQSRYDTQGEDVGGPSFKQGYLNILVDPSQQRLQVDVKPDHASYGPGDTVTVSLRVHDARGHGVPGSITLAAVDLGVLNLIGYQTPDAFDSFYSPRGLAVDNAESRSFILGSHKLGEKGSPGGGGGADGAGQLSMRHNFKMTAYWNPSIRTDAQGRAQVRFKLPDNLSTFRLMALAQTRSSRFGSAEAQFMVSKPLVLVGSGPGFATVGDHFSAGVTLTNHTPERQTATVRAQTTGGVTMRGAVEKTVDVPAQGTQLVTFDYEATRADGPARMVFSGTMGGDSDTLELPLVLEVPKEMEAVASSGTTETDAEETVAVPANAVSGSCRVEVGMASTALVSLRNALKSLVDYPYGCLEQKLSKIYPMVLGEDLASQFNIDNFNQAKAHEYIVDFIAHFPDYQQESGGCTLWGKPDDPINPWVSCYALMVLTQAGQHGYELPARAMESLRSYVESVLTMEDEGWLWPFHPSDRLETRCLALYALALNGADVDSSIDELYDKQDKLSLTSKALLVRAMVRSGHFKGRVARMVEAFQQDIQLDPTQGYIEAEEVRESEWVYYSRVRTTAVVLAALLDAGETGHAADMMRWLLKHSKGGEWDTTQDNAWALDAALTYIRQLEHDVPDFTAKVILDGKAAVAKDFHGRSTDVVNRSIPLNDADQGHSEMLLYHKSGTGRLYYTTRLFYAAQDGARWARDEGLAVDKHVTTLDGVETSQFKAGQMYMVSLTVASPTGRTYVVVDDPVPAGFEVVQTNFETESVHLRQTLDMEHGFGSFDHFETYDDRVLMFADWMYEGSHEFSYLVRAMYPGEYWQGSTQAKAMYEPDIYGGTAASHITVSP